MRGLGGLCASLLVTIPAAVPITPAQAVTYGDPVAPDRAPWAVTVMQLNSNGDLAPGRGDPFCSGVAVNEVTVLTAAHCMVDEVEGDLDPGAGRLAVGFGSSRLDRQRLVAVSGVEVDGGFFDTQGLSHDAAVLRLLTPLPITAFPVLATPEQAKWVRSADAGLTLWGWGATEKRSAMGSLRRARLTIATVAARTYYRGDFKEKWQLGAARLDAGTKGYQVSCRGDSGAPLTTQLNGQIVVMGLVKGGAPKGCQVKAPTILTSVGDEAEWLAAAIDPGHQDPGYPDLARPYPTGPGPRITGSPTPGAQLTCDPGSWTANLTSLKYRWTVVGNTKSLGRATQFTVRAKDIGKRIACHVTGRSPGGRHVAHSPASAKVA